MPSASSDSSKRFPVVSQNALKSGTEPGSVANTSKVAPFGNPESAFRVLRIGSGQARPFKSKVLSAMGGSRRGAARVGRAASDIKPSEQLATMSGKLQGGALRASRVHATMV